MTAAEHASRLRLIRRTKRMQATKLSNELAAMNGEISSLTAAIDLLDPPSENQKGDR